MPVCLSLFPSVPLSLCPFVRVTFCRWKRVACNCTQRMQPQATGSAHLKIQNILILYVYYYVSSDKFILRRAYGNGTKPAGGKIPWVALEYVHPPVQSSAGLFWVFLFVFISSVGVQCRGAFIPILGSEGPRWCPFELICISLCLSVSLSGCPRRVLEIICAAHHCTQSMRPRAAGLNPLSGSIIFPSVCPSGCPRAFWYFCICINSSGGVQRCGAFILYKYVYFYIAPGGVLCQ